MARSPRKHLLRAADELDAFSVVLRTHPEAAAAVHAALTPETLAEIEKARALMRQAAGRLSPNRIQEVDS